MQLDLNSIQQEVIRISREVGKFIKHEQNRISSQNVEEKGRNDFVTYVDKAAETLLVSELSALIPDCGFITEENTVSQEEKEFIWIIDPIDGTTNFIHGLPLFSISIALMYEKRIILGLILEVTNDECFHSIEGGPAYLNDKQISVSKRPKLSDSLIVTGFPYRDEGRLEAWMKLFIHLLQNSHGVRRLGSAAIDLAYVACGRFEAFYEYGLSPWDVAAGGFIVKQAGGEVSDFSGEENWLFGKELMAGNGLMNEELLNVIKQKFNEIMLK
ncbi:MAG: inositol monophosphatase family protein [Bacteroidia bacterium]